MKPLLSFSRLLALFLLLAPVPCALSVESAYLVTPDSLNAKIKEVAASTELDEATRNELTELYRKALSYLETVSTSLAASESFRTARQTADAEATAVREEIERTAKTSPADELKVSAQMPLADIEQLLLKEKANRAAVAAKLSEREERLIVEADRPAAVREQLGQLTQRKEARDAELKSPVLVNESPLLAEANNWLLQSEGKALSAQLKMLDQELLSQPMRVKLLKAMRDKSALSLQRIDIRLQLLEEMLNSKRATEAEKARTETVQAVREAMGKHPLVQRLAAQNAALSEELSALAANLEQVRADETSASRDAKRFEDDFRSTKQKLEFAGLSQALGQVMLEQRRMLPNARLISRKATQLETKIADAGLRLIQDEEERRQLQSLVDYVDGLMEQLPAGETESIRGELERLAAARQALLDKTIDTRQIFVRALGELDVTQRHLVASVQNYDSFMAQRLLWIRSSPAPSLPMLQAIPDQVAVLLSPDNWREVLGILTVELLQSPVMVLGVALFCVLLWKRRTMRAALLASGKKIGKIKTDRFTFTFQALVLTLLLAAPWPLLFAISSWQLAHSAESTDFVRAVARALEWVATAGFYLTSFHVLCAPGGLAAAHFRWPVPSIKRLQRGLTRLKLTMLPAAFVALVIINYEIPTLGGGLGRLALVIVLMTLAVFFYRVFEPRRGVLHLYQDRHPKGAIARLRYLWLALTVVLPLVLAGMGVLGYLYTAGTLTENLIDTMWLVLILLVIQQLVIRWLLLTRRRLAYQAAIERREAARAREVEASEPPGSESFSDQLEEPEVDLNALSQDSLKLLNMVLDIIGAIGIWLIWSKVVPAFGVLNDITLWHGTAMVSGQSQTVPITLADAGLAVIIAVITVISTKRFPALLEIGLLQRLNIDPGGRYAATTLSRYLIAAVGTILVFGTIGASWSQIQWLVAALGVGIGFGLQEIVANFISGIIILFERPIRVGDTVTVGDTDGVVTRIQIRATTIRNWDGKELLVPNKEFITARLLNWTLTDQLTRIVIPVGLAYGGDVTKAMSLMLEAANKHSRVLQEPRPSVIFDEFADNALSLKLRCFVASMDYRIETVSELHEAINQKFNDARLVIAFPQRDVHLDASRPLDIRVLREMPEPGV